MDQIVRAQNVLTQGATPPMINYGEFREYILAMSSKGNIKRNAAALAHLMRLVGKKADDPIGPELAGSEYHRRYEELAAESRLQLPAGFSNRMSAVRQLRQFYLEMVSAVHFGSQPGVENPSSHRAAFEAVLTRVGLTFGQAIKVYGAGLHENWRPDRNGFRSSKVFQMAKSLEDAAGWPGYLTRFVKHAPQVTMVANFSKHVDPYRRLHAAMQAPYRANFARPELAHIKEPVEEYIRFKTGPVPPFGMQRYSRWSQNKEGRYGTGEIFYDYAERFFGWIMLSLSSDTKYSGLGLSPQDVSFGMLGCSGLALGFWKFKAARGEIREGRFTGQAQDIFNTLLTLTRKDTGWLAQTEFRWLDPLREQLARLEGGEEQLREGYFVAQHEAMAKWVKDAKVVKNSVRLRNPHVTCKPFLDVDSPMKDYIFPLIRNMVADRRGQSAPILHRLSHERDLIMIVAFFSFPLRLINWRLCEVGVNIYRTNGGAWVLSLTREEFKNREFLPPDFRYHLKLPVWSQPFFSNYIESVIPQLQCQRDGVQWLLPVLKPTKRSIAGSAQDEQKLAGDFANVFLRYFGFRIRPHAARHIVATDYLKADPRSVDTVATILNDRPETVRRAYAHLVTQDYANPYDAHMSAKAASVLGLPPSRSVRV